MRRHEFRGCNLLVIFTLGLGLVLCGCSKTGNISKTETESASGKVSETAESESAIEKNSEAKKEDPSLTSLRLAAKAAGNAAIVIDLGYLNAAEGSGNLSDYDKYENQLSRYLFLTGIPKERLIGQESGYSNAFCIVPTDSNAKVEIYSTNGPDESGQLKRDELLYSADRGNPLIVRCFVADFYSNMLISVTDPSGLSIEDYNPVFSGEDGSLILTDGHGNRLYEAR